MNTPAKRGYGLRPLIVAQFFGAFNDNAWKLIVMALGLNLLTRGTGAGPDFLQEQEVATWAFVVFNVPMLLFSLPAGVLADRVSKRNVIVAMKVAELLFMAAGLVVLLAAPANAIATLAVLGLMGVQSALFSPAKLGILPELLPHEKLSAGNGFLEMWSMLGIIAGTGLGTVLLTRDDSGVIDNAWVAAVPLVALAVVGLVASLRIPRLPPATVAATHGPVRDLVENVRIGWQIMCQDRVVWLTVVGQVVYWTLVSLLGQNMIIYTHEITAGFENPEKLTGVPLAIFGLGLGVGAVASGRLSGGKVEFGLLPLGAIIFAATTLTVSLARPGFWGTLILMPFLGAASGLIAVPLNAILQWRSPADRRGAVIALANVFVLAGTATGSIVAYGLALLHFDPANIFLAGAIAVLAATVWSVYLLPEALLRLVLFLLTHSVYRIRVAGQENVPQTGGVLLAPNHVSFVDGLLLMASLDRPVRFVVQAETLKNWWLRPFLKTLQAIPLGAVEDPGAIQSALHEAGAHLDRGEVVCVFPEGQLTRTGQLQPFREEYERLLKGRNAVIVPVYLDRVWGSIFSHAGGRLFWKLPREIPYRVHLRFGKPLPADTPMHEVRRAVDDLSLERMTQK